MFEADFVSKDSDQTETAPRTFKLGPLGSLNQVTKGLAKTIRAMADGTLDSQVGARIMRTCLETAKLERLDERLSTLESNEYVNTPLRSTGAQTFQD
jgi:hypothetical protein